MYCKNCGILLEDDSNFCVSCGTAVNGGPIEGRPASEGGEMLVPVRTVYMPARPSMPGKGLGIASMAVGISSLSMWWTFCIPIPLAIVGFILGLVARKKAKKAEMKNGMAKVGIICSAIGFVLTIVFWTVLILMSVFP